MTDWIRTSLHVPPEGEMVDTKIDDISGPRHEQRMTRRGQLWFVEGDSMYVYFTPTHWRPVDRTTEKP